MGSLEVTMGMKLQELKNALLEKGYVYHEEVEVTPTKGGKVNRYKIVYAIKRSTGEKNYLGMKSLIMKRTFKSFQKEDVWKALDKVI